MIQKKHFFTEFILMNFFFLLKRWHLIKSLNVSSIKIKTASITPPAPHSSGCSSPTVSAVVNSAPWKSFDGLVLRSKNKNKNV